MIRKVALYGTSLMIMTSLHHMYGAFHYDTPWRLHMLFFSLPVVLLNWLAIKWPSRSRLLYPAFCLANFILSIWFVGLYEGVYNHLAKNLLFFSGINAQIMASLFPPPMYEMPNDFFFEFTGILQALLVFPLGYYFIVMVAGNRARKQPGN